MIWISILNIFFPEVILACLYLNSSILRTPFWAHFPAPWVRFTLLPAVGSLPHFTSIPRFLKTGLLKWVISIGPAQPYPLHLHSHRWSQTQGSEPGSPWGSGSRPLRSGWAGGWVGGWLRWGRGCRLDDSVAQLPPMQLLVLSPPSQPGQQNMNTCNFRGSEFYQRGEEYTRMHVHTYTHTHTHMHKRTHAHIHTYTRTNIHMSVCWDMYTHIHIHTDCPQKQSGF